MDWRQAFHTGFVPHFRPETLAALSRALVRDDPSLVQELTVDPPCYPATAQLTPAGGCLFGWCIIREGAATVEAVEEAFLQARRAVNEKCGDELATWEILAYWDETERSLARATILNELREVMKVGDL